MHSGREPRHAPLPPHDVVANGRHHPVNQRVAHGDGHMQWQATTGVHLNNGRGQWSVAASSSSHHYERPVHSHFDRNQYGISHNNPHYGRESQPDVRRVAPVQNYPQSYGYAAYPPPVPQIPVAGPYVQNPPSAYGAYQRHSTQQWQPRYGTGGGAPSNPQPPVGRGYDNNHRQPHNRYSALNRGGSNRGPPPRPGHGRY